MNSIIQEAYPIFQMYQALRNQLLDILTGDDLDYSPGGANSTLGQLCREIGEVQYSYIDSFKTFAQDFSYRHADSEVETNVAKLAAWLAELDQDLRNTIEGLSEDDIQNKVIDRGPDFKLPPRIQLEVYKEALLIFYGKAMVYLKAMGKTPPQQWQEWIG